MLPLSDFYTHPLTADGYLNSCKECKRAYARHHGRTSERVRIYDRQRARRPERVIAMRARERFYDQTRPEMKRAHRKVGRAIRSGRLVPQPCLVCGAAEVQAHHHAGYDEQNALNVVWLCVKHHKEQHRKYDVPPLPTVAA